MLDGNKKHFLAEKLWGESANPWLLIGATCLLLLFMLGAKDIWTQEWRWADISYQMLIRHDFLHPFLKNSPYYDKPLLSYWLIVLTSFITGFNSWALRLPSVIAGIATVWSTYWLGRHLINRRTGFIASWLLITTFFFVFWARVASTDILNVAGIMLALVWYFSHKNDKSFKSYFIFFLIGAVACLLKGLVGGAIIFMALLPELIHEKRWKQHLNLSVILPLVLALVVYLTPFALSAYFNQSHYQESGFHLVFRENVMRYFEPFDHRGALYTYFLYLPLCVQA